MEILTGNLTVEDEDTGDPEYFSLWKVLSDKKIETVCTTHEYFLKVICVQKTRKCIKEMTIQSVGGLTLHIVACMEPTMKLTDR